MKKIVYVILVLTLMSALLIACTLNPTDVPTDGNNETLADWSTQPLPPDTVKDAADATVTDLPTDPPADVPTDALTDVPTDSPVEQPTDEPTEAPTEAETVPGITVKSMTPFYNFVGLEGTPDINGSQGWNFNTENYRMTYENNKLVIRSLNSELVVCRLNLTADERTACTADIVDMADAIGFYFENNSDESVGIAYFGEIVRPDMDGEHQQRYMNHYNFYDIECYLVSEDGKVSKGQEYFHDNYAGIMCNGLCEVPAHFKGYYVCTLATLGHDLCSYGAWNEHSSDACQNGTYIKGSYITNVGFSMANANPGSDAYYVIGDYVFVNFNR